MEEGSRLESEVPVWARPDAFPAKPGGQAEFGFIDVKGRMHGAKDEDELALKVKRSAQRVDLVWTPDSDRLQVAEQVCFLHSALRERLGKQARRDISDGKRMGLVFGLMMIWTFYAAWSNSGGQLSALYTHQLTGLAAMLFFFFGILPFVEGVTLKRQLARTRASDLGKEIPEAQFEAWIHRQRIPATRFLLIALGLCGLVQILADKSFLHFKASVIEAGLLKQAAASYPQQADGGAWWRMLTAPMLHGNLVHLLMNGAGLLYLGRRTEILARWPHVLIVFAAASWVGGVASFYWIAERISVGASGGLTGLLGFLLVFESMHPSIVPKPARFRLLAGLLILVVIGFLGVSFIDNAAHAGGLAAGIAYALIVFPPSSSIHRPERMIKDVFAGALAACLVVGVVCLVGIKVLT